MYFLFNHFNTDRAVAPVFTKPLKEIHANIDSSVTLECRVAGSEPLAVSWFKNLKELHNDEKYELDFCESTASLRIRGLAQSDGGEYICRATNPAGTEETSGSVLVKGLRK